MIRANIHIYAIQSAKQLPFLGFAYIIEKTVTQWHYFRLGYSLLLISRISFPAATGLVLSDAKVCCRAWSGWKIGWLLWVYYKNVRFWRKNKTFSTFVLKRNVSTMVITKQVREILDTMPHRTCNRVFVQQCQRTYLHLYSLTYSACPYPHLSECEGGIYRADIISSDFPLYCIFVVIYEETQRQRLLDKHTPFSSLKIAF